MLIGGPNWKGTPLRKFDIRWFGIAQIVDGKHFRGYFFRQGYIRTSSYKFNLHDLEDRDVHLTNDAVQDRNDEYGKYEPGNKVSMEDF
jgi:tubulin---tyrosine ligase